MKKMKKSLFLFCLCFLVIIGCTEKKTESKSYIDITNQQQIDSITKIFIVSHRLKWNIKTKNG